VARCSRVLHGAKKLRYADEYEAQRAAERRMAQGAEPLFTYWCPYCTGCHLTSTPPRQ